MLAILIIVFGIINPVFLKISNLFNILSQNSIIGIVSLGMTLVIIIGGIDLSVGSVVAFTGMLFAILVSNGMPIFIAIIISIIAGIGFGFINGALIIKGKIPAFIATLGMMSAARGGTLLISGSKSVSIGNSSLNSIVNLSIAGITVPSFVFIVFLIKHIGENIFMQLEVMKKRHYSMVLMFLYSLY